MKITVEGLEGLPEVGPGDDLAELIAQSAPQLRDGDVIVVTSKIVSKAEGQLVSAAGPAARQAVIDAQTARLVAAWGDTRIVATRHGFVVAAAGVDGSNTRPGTLLLLPADPDASARRIRAGLRDRLGVQVGVVVTDTFGRPWRAGQTDVAVGAAGVAPVEDLRGRVDAWGNTLGVTVLAVADEVAAAADLVKRKLAGIPVAVVRGLGHLVLDDDGPGAQALVRPLDEDRFPLGATEAARAGVWAAVLGGQAAGGAPPGADLPLLTPVAQPTEERLRDLLRLAGAGDLDGRVRPADRAAGAGPSVGRWYVEVLAPAPHPDGDPTAPGQPAGPPVATTPPSVPGSVTGRLLVEVGRVLERVRVLARAEGLAADWVAHDAIPPADGGAGAPPPDPAAGSAAPRPVLGRLLVSQRSR